MINLPTGINSRECILRNFKPGQVVAVACWGTWKPFLIVKHEDYTTYLMNQKTKKIFKKYDSETAFLVE